MSQTFRESVYAAFHYGAILGMVVIWLVFLAHGVPQSVWRLGGTAWLVAVGIIGIPSIISKGYL